MKYLVLVAALFLASCETIRINGVEIDRETQAVGIFAAALALGALYVLQQNDDDESTSVCGPGVVAIGGGAFQQTPNPCSQITAN